VKLSIRDCLHTYAAGLKKTWQHDRLNTVGASEIGQCLRKTWFGKWEVVPDPGYVDRFGAKLRGNLIEDHYWVPGLRASLPEGMELLYAGEDQQTLVDGYLSATTDGVLTGVPRDALAWMGVPDIKSDCVNLDCKSIDPRVELRIEKPEHSFQVQAQMGLIRFATEYQPEYSILSYVDASFLDDIKEFAVAFDPAVYQAAKDRARLIMTAEHALELSAEGKITGGGECRYCPWSSHCAAVTVAGIPKEDKSLGDNAAATLKRLRDEEREAEERLDFWKTEHAQFKEKIKEFLRENQIRRYTGEGWSVSWSSVKGREVVDIKAAEAAGIDLSPYRKVGDPADRLTIK
jgi:hypothetical protein